MEIILKIQILGLSEIATQFPFYIAIHVFFLFTFFSESF